jgi:hypothetical protein
MAAPGRLPKDAVTFFEKSEPTIRKALRYADENVA